MSEKRHFKHLVSREVTFTTRNKDLVRFGLRNGDLEVSINGTFGKTLLVLRVDDCMGRMVCDQDDWTTIVPSALLKVTEKIASLAKVAQVPVFTFCGLECASEASALLQMQHEGRLQILWLESHRCEMTMIPSKDEFPQIHKISKWLASKKFILAVEEVSANQIHLETLKAFAETADSHCLVVPRAARGFALALCLAQLLEKQRPLMLLGSDLPVTCEVAKAFKAMSQAATGTCVWSCPPDAAHEALVLVEELLQVYRASRAFVHGLIGSGVPESVLVEALERSVGFLQSAEVLPMAPPVVAPISVSRRAKSLQPVGRAGIALGTLAQEQLQNLWRHGEWNDRQGDTLILLDLSDPAAVSFLRQRQTQPEDGESPHVLALLPGMAATRNAWKSVAEPLAILLGAGEESPDLGLVMAMSLGDAHGLDVRDCVLLLEALATAPLAEAEFQLRPFPQIHLVLASFQEPIAAAKPMVLGGELDQGEVTSSFSLWPTGSPRLLQEEFLKPDFPAEVAIGGAAYQPAQSSREPRVWHLLLDEEREAAVLKRAAGDFAGRAQGAFHFRASEGACSDLWSLALKLHEGPEDAPEIDEAADEAPADQASEVGQMSDGYGEDYEEEEPLSSSAQSDASH